MARPGYRQPTITQTLPQQDLHRTYNGGFHSSVSSPTSRSHGRTTVQTQLKQQNNKRSTYWGNLCIFSTSNFITVLCYTYSFPPWNSGGSCSSLQALGGLRPFVAYGKKTPHCPLHYGPQIPSTRQENPYIKVTYLSVYEQLIISQLHCTSGVTFITYLTCCCRSF